MVDNHDQIISAIMRCKTSANKNTQSAASTVLLNFAVAYGNSVDVEAKSQCLSAAVTVAAGLKEPEAMFRMLVCLGTLMATDRNTAELAKVMEVPDFVARCKNVPEPQKVKECAGFLQKLLK